MSYREVDGKKVLDGIIGLHVDDILGCGMSGGGADGVRGGLADKMRDLADKLKFGKWRSRSPLHFTGVEVHIVSDALATRVVQEAYMQKV